MNNVQPMTYSAYEEIIVNGKCIDWYGFSTPEALCTTTVRDMANMIDGQIDKLVAEDLGTTKDYIQALRNNVINLPYKHEGADFYMIKRKEIEARHGIDRSKPISELPIERALTKKEKRQKRKKEQE